ncbi:MAG: hypothetical protein MNPFHGCM_02368 [Gemmatimonadaceae bacterium]|nr:hypothetical protein [Gemmatimonadaceae bacterium]
MCRVTGFRSPLAMTMWLASAIALALVASRLEGQTIAGKARETVTSLLLTQVEIALLDSASRTIANTRTGDSGTFALRAPAWGRYRLVARRLGFKSAISPWLVLDESTGTLTYDLLLDAAPHALTGVITEGRGDPAGVSSRFGLDPGNINAFVVPPDSVRLWSASAHAISDLLRRIGIAGGLTVREEDSGEPCIQLAGRDRHCMLIVVDDIVTAHIRDLDIGTVEDIVVMRPNEAGLWFGSLSRDQSGRGANDPNQRSTAGGVLLIRTKLGRGRGSAR